MAKDKLVYFQRLEPTTELAPVAILRRAASEVARVTNKLVEGRVVVQGVGGAGWLTAAPRLLPPATIVVTAVGAAGSSDTGEIRKPPAAIVSE